MTITEYEARKLIGQINAKKRWKGKSKADKRKHSKMMLEKRWGQSRLQASKKNNKI